MRLRITLDETEMTTAIRDYLEKQGYTNVQLIAFSRDGFPDSPDPRKRLLSYSVSASVER